jgi:hypothetical protein
VSTRLGILVGGIVGAVALCQSIYRQMPERWRAEISRSFGRRGDLLRSQRLTGSNTAGGRGMTLLAGANGNAGAVFPSLQGRRRPRTCRVCCAGAAHAPALHPPISAPPRS